MPASRPATVLGARSTAAHRACERTNLAGWAPGFPPKALALFNRKLHSHLQSSANHEAFGSRRARLGVANVLRLTEYAALVELMEGAGAMPGTISKHIRIDEELWKRLETAAGEIDTTANRLLAELAERWLETREWPQSDVQVQVARASVFAAQAIALDMIAAGRQKRVDQLLEHAASIVPGIAPQSPVTEEAATVKSGSSQENS